MGKTKRRKGYELPHGGVMMKERVSEPQSPEWFEKRKKEKQMQRRLRKMRK